MDKSIEHEVILLLEHPAVFTLGNRGGRENLTVSEAFLKSRNVSIVETNRGGNITFHGPGQVVLYPILNLETLTISVPEFVYCLEEIMIRTCADSGVTACRNDRNHGIWVRDEKIGSIGLSIKKRICFHGLSLNVAVDLKPFSWMNPCGLQGVTMTCLETEILKSGRPVNTNSVRQAKERLLKHFSLIFNAELNPIDRLPGHLGRIMDDSFNFSAPVNS